MAFIPYVPDDQASPELKELYDRLRSTDGQVDNILRIHSLAPAGMQAHYDLYRTVMYGPSPLSRTQREMIGVTVSAINRCFY